MSHEETLGLINGLAAVVREQNAAIKSRAKELTQLVSAMKEHSTCFGQSSSPPSYGYLRLLYLTLPEFTGKLEVMLVMLGMIRSPQNEIFQ